MPFVSPALIVVLIVLYASKARMPRDLGFGLRMLVIGLLMGWKLALLLMPRPASHAFTVQVNGKDSPITCTTGPLGSGANYCTDTTHALLVRAGDRITLKTT
jgi:hypothetical protein